MRCRAVLSSLVLAAAVAALRDRPRAATRAAGALHGRVVRVVDGDTIQVRLDGGRTSACATSASTRRSRSSPARRCSASRRRPATFNAGAGRRARRASANRRRGSATATAACWPTSTARPTDVRQRELVARGYARTLTIPPNVAPRGRVRAARRGAPRAGRAWASGERLLSVVPVGCRVMATRMRQSLAEFERAFVEETQVDRVRREALRRQAVQRARQRQVERVHKHGTMPASWCSCSCCSPPRCSSRSRCSRRSTS